MVSWDFRNMIYNLEGIGLLEVLVPFLLVFTIIYAVLQKTKILGKTEDGKPKKNFNVVIALVMALAVVVTSATGQYSGQPSVVDIINTSIPGVALVAIAIVMVLILIGVFGKELDIGASNYGGIFVILSFLIIGFIFASAADLFDRSYIPSWLTFIYDSQFQALIVAIVVFGLIIYLITKEDKPKGKDDSNALKEFKMMLKEPK